MRKTFLLLSLLSVFSTISTKAQVFEGDADWEDNEKTIIIGKWSQLYYELNVGWDVTSGSESHADFLYGSIGLNWDVSTENAWRKFLPKQKIPDNEEEAALFGSMDTKDVYAGKIGFGWIHYFNHSIGMYAQASWGFLADFGSPSDEDTSTTSSSDSGKKTLIYNTVPVEIGVCLNCWKHLHIQGGITYMWKEIPLLTVGIGYNL